MIRIWLLSFLLAKTAEALRTSVALEPTQDVLTPVQKPIKTAKCTDSQCAGHQPMGNSQKKFFRKKALQAQVKKTRKPVKCPDEHGCGKNPIEKSRKKFFR